MKLQVSGGIDSLTLIDEHGHTVCTFAVCDEEARQVANEIVRRFNTQSETFRKKVVAGPAFDKRSADPKKNYGIHGVDITFYLIGEKGAIQFVIYTNWHLPHVQAEMDSKPLSDFPYMFHKPMAADIGYHSHTPMYEGQTSMGKCNVLDAENCYYDGSGLQAEEIFENIFLPQGTDGLWAEMERRYREWFGVTES